ncbi:MAG: hypothetical protein NZO58_03545 [Gemmataceae bacterium]|nr:hypothetical protein [Gemmataceae bacterium]
MRAAFWCALTIVSIPTISLGQTSDEGWELLLDGKTSLPLEHAKFTAGTRPLAWLAADGAAPKKGKSAPAPEYLEFREENSTSFKDGIVTLVPLSSVLRLEYVPEKKQVRVTVKAADGEQVLVGPTRYVGVNKFNVEGSVAPARVPVAGDVQFHDGLMKTPFLGFARKTAKPVPAPTGRRAVVVGQDVVAKKNDAEAVRHPVHDLVPLYRVGAGQQLAKVLMFQKVGQLDTDRIVGMRHVPLADKKPTASREYEVTVTGGEKQRLSLLDETVLGDNQKAKLIGLVGRVPAGYKLFPPHTIAEVLFDAP